ncbi:MAG: endonuclease MutS2 [Anaerolineae bacterium]
MNHHWETLEYPKILEQLARHTDFSGGVALVKALEPTSDVREARERLQLTTEARALLEAHPEIGLGGVTDIRPLVDRARHGITLDPTELLQVRDTLRAAQQLQRRLTRLEAQFPALADVAWRIAAQPSLVEAIGRVLTDRGEIRDGASPELTRIRREMDTTQTRVMAKLERMLNSPAVAPYLQEAVITRREGRYVIPVQASYKSKVEGVVHDRSSSGVTYFMEPLAVVELNNALRELRLAEEEEIRRLLAALSQQVRAVAEQLDTTVAALASLDLTFAKARYAEVLQATEPRLTAVPTSPQEPRQGNLHPGAVVRLPGARHPLLDPETVVPVDVELDEEVHVLVLTGPNTGGKTVTLKTVGLLTLMAQAGLHIPADEGAALTCFEAVYADIGDEQSIEQSLSTFSSHLGNILSFLEAADHRALVLLDELGAGTDPAEGSALARALLEAFRERRCMAFVATHYPELKLYAHNTPGVRNASMEFDTETLAPTFRLAIGLPGRSNAFAIARRLGMPASIIREAEAMVSGEALRADEMLDDLHRLRVQAAQARDAARQAEAEAAARERALQARLAALDEEREEILRQAEAEARTELEALRKEVRDLRRRLQLGVPTAGSRRTLEEAETALEALEQQVEELAPTPTRVQEAPAGPVKGTLQVGDSVRVRSWDVKGSVAAVEGDEVEVQAGAMRTRVPLDDVELLSAHPEPEVPEPASAPQTSSPGMELDLRGMVVEEACRRLDRYLDDAAMATLPWVRIIHGKGTGALRRAVRELLHEHPLVTAYDSAAPRDGGEGVTIAQLVKV